MPKQIYFFWLLLGTLGIWLGFPNTLYHVPALVLLFPLSLYIIGVQASSKTEALRKGWLLGLLGSSAALYWLAIPIHNVGMLPWPLAIPCALAIGAYVGFYAGIFSLLVLILRQHIVHNFALCIALACIWYILEFLRGILLTGFPWLQISSAFVPWPVMVQAVSIIGSYALSALYVLAALCFASAMLYKKINLALAGAICIIIPVVFGLITLQANPMQEHNENKDYAFIMAEGNIDQNIKWEPKSQQSSLDIYENLTYNAVELWRKNNPNAKNAIILWPETAMPFYLEHHPKLTPELMQFIKNMQLPLLVGAPGIIVYSKEKREVYNRAYLLDAQGRISSFYDKMHLVPFGEYVPPWLLVNFLEPLLQGIGNFTQGKQSKPLKYNELALGMLICYEGVFPHLARQRVMQGANVLVNISNDGWFGNSSAPEQHLQLSMLRAIEQGRFLVRSTNTGISAIVDNFGRFVLKGGQFKAQSYTGYAQLKSHNTVFFYLYPWISPIILIVLLAALFMGKRRLKI